MENNDKKQNIILIIIAAIIVIVGIIGIIYFYGSDEGKSSAEKEDEIKKQFQEISDKFTALSAEMLEDDGETIKGEYTDAQRETFKAILSKIGEADEYMNDAKEGDSSISQDEYYDGLSEKLKEINSMLTALDNDIHTDSTEFEQTFTDLSDIFNKLVEKATVKDDNKTLLDEYKDFQTDYDEIYGDILALYDDAKEENHNQEYYDNLTEKGKKILEKVNELIEKANISLE